MTVPSETSYKVDAGRPWTGGVATALVAIVGVMICRGLLDVPVLAPTGKGTIGDVSTFRLAGLAIGISIGSLLSAVGRSAVRRRV